MRLWLIQLRQNSFVRAVTVLASGTALGQAVAVLVLPMLTRLYTPQDFSALAVYTGLLGIISVAACLRLEIAIPIPERDEDAANLLALALCSAAVIAALFGGLLWIFPLEIVYLIEQPALKSYLWLLPLGIWLSSSYSALQFWSTRKKKFSDIARTKLTQAIGGASSQVGLGWAGLAPFGLLIGHMISSGAGLFGLGRTALRENGSDLRAIRCSEMYRMLREYNRFPKFSTLEAFANTAGIQLPVIIIAALASGPEAGYLMLATRVMAAPISLIGSAVSQVYLSHGPEEMRAGNLGRFTSNVLEGLAKVGIGPLIFTAITASPVSTIAFGPEWKRVGDIIAWMTPWFIFQFLSSPVSMVMHIRNLQKSIAILTGAGLIIRLGAIILAAKFAQGYFSEFYAISGAVFYFICYWTFTRAANMNFTDALKSIQKATVSILGWLLAGVFLRSILGHM